MQESVWVRAAVVIIVALALYLVPIYRRNESYFGVRLPEQFYVSHEGKRYFKTWRASLGIFSTVILGVLIATAFYSVTSALFPILMALFIIWQGVLYARANTHLKEFELLEDIRTSRTAASLAVRKLTDFLNPWIEFTVLILLIFPAVLLISQYDKLPEFFPRHWNFWGAGERVVPASFWSVFLPSISAIGLYFLIQVLSLFIVKSKISLPDENAKVYYDLKVKQMTTFLRMIDLVKVSLIARLGLTAAIPIIYQSTRSDYLPEIVNAVNGVVFVTIIVGVALFLKKNSKINAQLRTSSGTVNVGYRDESKYWKWGIFYINQDDPAIWVERRDGLGYTVNLGRPVTVLIIASLVVILLAILARMTLLS